MTVTEIVNDLLEYKMITAEAALVLLKAESQASINNVNMIPQGNQVFQPYHGVLNGDKSNPYYVSTTTNDVIVGTTANGNRLSAGANELLKIK
jgi:hypothetical protein